MTYRKLSDIFATESYNKIHFTIQTYNMTPKKTESSSDTYIKGKTIPMSIQTTKKVRELFREVIREYKSTHINRVDANQNEVLYEACNALSEKLKANGNV